MKTVTVKLSEIAKDPTMRLDAKYWVDKKNSEKSVKTKKEITNQLKYLQEQKAKYIKEHNSKSSSEKSLIANRIHNDLIAIYNYQITTLNWVLGKRKNLL
jgi:hypothetical protein